MSLTLCSLTKQRNGVFAQVSPHRRTVRKTCQTTHQEHNTLAPFPHPFDPADIYLNRIIICESL